MLFQYNLIIFYYLITNNLHIYAYPMFWKSFFLVVCFLFFLSFGLIHAQSDSTKQGWQLVWSDEFEGDQLDPEKWSYQIGDGSEYGIPGWGNNELQYYTSRQNNVFLQDGRLHIVAREESYNGFNHTSARIRTIDKGDWTNGRFEIRAKLPKGQGIRPAIWMMPTHSAYGGWAASGEIDIMELIGHQPNIVHGTIHYGASWPNNVHSGGSYTLPTGDFSDNFHTFSIEWEEGEIRWFMDDIHYLTLNDWYTVGFAFPAPFNQDFHFLLNIAVGGNWPGYPDHTTSFPQEMVVEYVRVYEAAQNTGTEEEADFPVKARLLENYPNPFNPSTTIPFELAQTATVRLEVYDMLGRRVALLVNETRQAGMHIAMFESADLSSGVYIARLVADDQVSNRKMVLVK